jgi:amino acid adenylation domain-containing protein
VYNTDRVKAAAGHLTQIIKEVTKNPGIRVGDINPLTPQEKHQLLIEFNNTTVDYPRDKTIHQLFEEQVERTPDNIALVGSPGIEHKSYMTHMAYISYWELNEKSNQLARLLIEKGVKAGGIVAIMTGRSVKFIIGILGILKAGAAYLPIDPDYPEKRINYMLADSASKILLTSDAINRVPTPHLLSFHPSTLPPFNPSQSSSLAYVIYTSGSTGRPKAVMVEHRNILAYTNAYQEEFDLQPVDIVLQQALYGVDGSVEEIFPTLLNGARIAVPLREEIPDPRCLSRFIARHNVTLINCSSPILNQLNQLAKVNETRTIRLYISGADILKREYLTNIQGTGQVYNTYGPTETTICATYYKCTVEEAFIPIGKPIANYTIYILNRMKQLLPIGVPGELYIGGDGVTRDISITRS